MSFNSRLNGIVLGLATLLCGVSFAEGYANTTFSSIEEGHRYWMSRESSCNYVFHKDSEKKEIYWDFDGKDCIRGVTKLSCPDSSDVCVAESGSELKSLSNKNLVLSWAQKDGEKVRRVLYFSKEIPALHEDVSELSE